MKLKITFFILILAGAIGLYFYCKPDEETGKTVHRAKGYSIVSNKGIAIPASLYAGDTMKLNEKSAVNATYILVLDTCLDFKNEHIMPEVLVIYPESKFLAQSSLCSESFTRINDTSSHQRYKILDEVGIVNNTVLYSNPPIKYANFYNKKLVFNTYGTLKQFGDSIIISLPK